MLCIVRRLFHRNLELAIAKSRQIDSGLFVNNFATYFGWAAYFFGLLQRSSLGVQLEERVVHSHSGRCAQCSRERNSMDRRSALHSWSGCKGHGLEDAQRRRRLGRLCNIAGSVAKKELRNLRQYSSIKRDSEVGGLSLHTWCLCCCCC